MWRVRRSRTLVSVIVLCAVGFSVFCLLHYDHRTSITKEKSRFCPETVNPAVSHQDTAMDNPAINGRDTKTRQKSEELDINRMNNLLQAYSLKMRLQVLGMQSRNYSSGVISPLTTLPIIYFITPTIARLEQKADLTRLSHTLRLVPRLYWIVIEDSEKRSRLVIKLLARYKVPYTHLAIRSSKNEVEVLKSIGKLPQNFVMPKGVEQRNLALEWVTRYARQPSVFYFGDDDNTYDLQLFEEMRYTRKVSVWPVGLIGNALLQTPLVKNSKVIGWANGHASTRKFPADMAAFAVNTDMLTGQNPPRFHITVGHGYTETDFLEQICRSNDDFEPRADNCTKVLVWHTKTTRSRLDNNNNVKNKLSQYNKTVPEV